MGVWWPDDECFYYGVIKEYDHESGKHLVHYDDDDMEWLVAHQGSTIQWVTPNGSSKTKSVDSRGDLLPP